MKTTMRWMVASLLTAGGCAFVLTAQQPVPKATPPSVFTVAQAEAGRASYQAACARCHTYDLRGRKGDAGENPPLDSLDENAQKMIKSYGGKVPQLAGPDFMARWGDKTASQLAFRIMSAAMEFTGDENATVERYLNVTAFVLQSNGAKAGPQALTTETPAKVGAVAGK